MWRGVSPPVPSVQTSQSIVVPQRMREVAVPVPPGVLKVH